MYYLYDYLYDYNNEDDSVKTVYLKRINVNRECDFFPLFYVY